MKGTISKIEEMCEEIYDSPHSSQCVICNTKFELDKPFVIICVDYGDDGGGNLFLCKSCGDNDVIVKAEVERREASTQI